MNILIVEDGKDKRHNIKKAIQRIKKAENCNIEVAKTYFSAKNKIILLKKNYDLIILDMFLPDAKDDEERKGLAGKDLIFDIMSAEIKIPILVVTQYTEYTNKLKKNERGEREIPHMMENLFYGKIIEKDKNRWYDCTYYKGLHEYLQAEAPIYLGIIFYSNQSRDWENNLKYFLNKLKEDN